MTDLKALVEQAIDHSGARSRIQSHLGDVVVADVSDGDVELVFTGFCNGCPLQPMTFVSQLRPSLEGIEGVRSVRLRGQQMSSYAVSRVAALATGRRPSLLIEDDGTCISQPQTSTLKVSE